MNPPMTAAPRTSPGRRHLHEIDFVRLLTFASVIAVHAVGSVGTDDSFGTGLALQVLHIGRETFFLITGFVLVFTHSTRTLGLNSATLRFWRKRFALVGLPYTVWSVLYWAVRLDGTPAFSGAALSQLAEFLLLGTARYHLYFLQISMQVYLVFPLLLWLVRRTRDHHAVVLTASAALQLGLLALLHHAPAPDGPLQTLWTMPNQVLLTYQFYLIAGAVAACHYDRLVVWVERHPWTTAGVVAGGLAVNWSVFAAQVAAGRSPVTASLPLQPVTAVWGVAALVGMLALGLRYRRSRRPGRLSAGVGEGARISFGVYLAHPLVLTATLDLFGLSHGASGLPTVVASVIATVCTAAGSALLVELVGRTPVAIAVTGRPRVRTGRNRWRAAERTVTARGPAPRQPAGVSTSSGFAPRGVSPSSATSVPSGAKAPTGPS